MKILMREIKSKNKYEIETYVNHWIEVTKDIFLSWGGNRKINNKKHIGPVYNLDEAHLHLHEI